MNGFYSVCNRRFVGYGGTSPHLLRYNERICINGIEVDDEMLCNAFERYYLFIYASTVEYFNIMVCDSLVLRKCHVFN